MARIWKEVLPRHGRMNLLSTEIIVVKVVSFTFRFGTVEQLRECIGYYEQKLHPSSRISAATLTADLGVDWREQRSWEVERWFERLPMYLLEESKRQKVLKALNQALVLAESGKI